MLLRASEKNYDNFQSSKCFRIFLFQFPFCACFSFTFAHQTGLQYLKIIRSEMHVMWTVQCCSGRELLQFTAPVVGDNPCIFHQDQYSSCAKYYNQKFTNMRSAQYYKYDFSMSSFYLSDPTQSSDSELFYVCNSYRQDIRVFQTIRKY